MKTFISRILAIAFCISPTFGNATGSIQEIGLPFYLEVSGLALDGSGGIYFRNDAELYRMDAQGRPSKVPFPVTADETETNWKGLSPASNQDGTLWIVLDSALFRLRKGMQWERFPIALPDETKYRCQAAGVDSIQAHVFCESKTMTYYFTGTYMAKFEKSGFSAWKRLPDMLIETIVLSGSRHAWITADPIVDKRRLPNHLFVLRLDSNSGAPSTQGPIEMEKTALKASSIHPDGKGGIWINSWPWKEIQHCDTALLCTPESRKQNVHATAVVDSNLEMALYMEQKPSQNWNKADISVGYMDSSSSRRTRIPLPSWWLRPYSRGSREFQAAKSREFQASLVSNGEQVWISLGNLIVLKEDSSWKAFHPNSLKAQKGSANRSNPARQLLGLTPYFATAGLVAMANHSGPGWVGETGWALLGAGAGTAVGLTTFLVGVNACWEGCPDPVQSAAGGVFLSLLATPMLGAAISLSKVSEADHRNGHFLPFATSFVGATLSTAAIVLLPENASSKYYLVIPALGLGAVVGYRLGL